MATAPYQREPQEALDDPTVQMTVLFWGKRLGKTEIMVNLVGGTIELNPRNILVAYPTAEGCKNFSKKFFSPLIKSTPALRGKIKESRTKDANNTILSKDFPGGNISIVTAGGNSSFRQVQAPVIILDEIDAMEETAEGDPVTLARGRAENYPDSIELLGGTPLLKGTSRIEYWYLKSDQRKWFCPCPKCGNYQVLKWEQVRWDNRPLEESVYVCEFCKAVLNDDDRLGMIKAGEWRPTAPFTGIRGYWLNGLNSTFPPKKGYCNKLHQFAKDFLDAKEKGEASLKSWINTFLTETWEIKGERVDHAPLLQRCEPYMDGGVLPKQVLCLTGAADIQEDRIEAEIIGWGLGEESWGIEYKVLIGNPDAPEVWQQLDAFWNKGFQHPSGSILKVACGLVDMGHKPRSVLRFTKPREIRRIYAVVGERSHWGPLVTRPKKSTIRRATTFVVGGDTAKETIFTRLRIDQPGPRYMHFPVGHGYDEEFFKQLTSEKLVTEYNDLNIPTERTWKKMRSRNEALDIRVYSLAALEILNPNWSALANTLKVDEKPNINETNSNDKQGESRAKPTGPTQPVRRFTRFRRW